VSKSTCHVTLEHLTLDA